MTNLIKICLVSLLSLITIPAHASPFSELATSMKPGTWAELQTIGINEAWGKTNGASGFISGYASEVKWDPVLQKLHYVGMDHANRPTSKSTVHVALSTLTNTWEFIAQDGTNFSPACSPNCVGSGASHQYDHLAIDPIGRKLYYRHNFVSKQIWQNSLDTGTATSWTPIPINPVVNSTVCCHAIEHVPFLGGILWVVQNYGLPSGNGRFSFLPDGGNAWQTVGNATGYSMGLHSGNLECSDVRQFCIFASGAGAIGVPQGPRLELFKIQKINGVITVTQLPNSPFGMGVHYGGVLTVDPVSGDFLFLKDAKTTTEAKEFWKIDGQTGAFTQMTGPAVPPDTVWNRISGVYDVHGVQAGPNSTHGVVMFVSCQQGANPCRLWIYKHAASVAPLNPPGPPTIQQTDLSKPSEMTFVQKCAQPGVVNCLAFDDPNHLLYNWDKNSVACNAAMAGKTWYAGSTKAPRPPTTVFAKDMGQGRCDFPRIDPVLKALKFDVLSQTGQSVTSYNGIFGKRPDGTFVCFSKRPECKEGNVYWFQYKQAVDTNHGENEYRCVSGCGGHKSIIIFGAPDIDSTACCANQLFLNNGYQTDVPTLAATQGTQSADYQNTVGCTAAKARASGATWPSATSQLVASYAGRHRWLAPINPDCKTFGRNQFREYTWKVTVGDSAIKNSAVTIWIDGTKVIEKSDIALNLDGPEGKGHGQFEFLAQLTGKDPTQIHPQGAVWYKDVIISSQPISMTIQ